MEIKVPTFPESVSEGTLISWFKQPGDIIRIDDILAEVETDKVVFEVPSPVTGIFKEQLTKIDETVLSEQAIAVIDEQEIADEPEEKQQKTEQKSEETAPVATESKTATQNQVSDAQTSPAVRKILAEKDLDKSEVTGTGKAGRITKADALNHQQIQQNRADNSELERRVPMSRIRKKIAERLLQSSQTTAMLTTFNEVNMQPIMDARTKYRDLFEKENQIKLGFMSFFVKATAQALLKHPDVNASIDNEDIVYHNYCDIGIAVSTDRGLVVPILRNAQNMTFAEVERTINEYALKARENKLTIDDLTGGTFSITNGGVFGSLMSTPIINPPQSAILGMHAINQRPVAENEEIVIRPMMYLALSYDHRIIDGKTSVTFLRNIKEMLEDPIRLVMNI